MSTAAFSLVDGGPLCRLWRRLGWVRPDGRSDYRRACLVVVAVIWGPLMLQALAEAVVTGQTPPIDWGLHGRLLVTIPLLFQAEASLHLRTREAITRFASEDWARDGQHQVAKIIAGIVRLRDALAPELILLGLALVASQAVVWDFGDAASLGRRLVVEPHRLGPKVWYALAALPVFQFLVYRTLWRWVLWTLLLWRLSRLPLRLVATHPDLAGGLEFLSLPSVGFSWIAAGLSATQAGVWANQVISGAAKATSFKVEAVALAAAAVALALGPLFFFTGHLWRCRFVGLRQYGNLATDYVRRFQQRWIEQPERHELLGSADIQSLADLRGSYEIVARMRPLPFSPLYLIPIAGAALLPMIPLALLEIPFSQLLAKLAGALLGKGPGG
jgi:hypothetical protein